MKKTFTSASFIAELFAFVGIHPNFETAELIRPHQLIPSGFI